MPGCQDDSGPALHDEEITMLESSKPLNMEESGIHSPRLAVWTSRRRFRLRCSPSAWQTVARKSARPLEAVRAASVWAPSLRNRFSALSTTEDATEEDRESTQQRCSSTQPTLTPRAPVFRDIHPCVGAMASELCDDVLFISYPGEGDLSLPASDFARRKSSTGRKVRFRVNYKKEVSTFNAEPFTTEDGQEWAAQLMWVGGKISTDKRMVELSSIPRNRSAYAQLKAIQMANLLARQVSRQGVARSHQPFPCIRDGSSFRFFGPYKSPKYETDLNSDDSKWYGEMSRNPYVAGPEVRRNWDTVSIETEESLQKHVDNGITFAVYDPPKGLNSVIFDLFSNDESAPGDMKRELARRQEESLLKTAGPVQVTGTALGFDSPPAKEELADEFPVDLTTAVVKLPDAGHSEGGCPSLGRKS